MDKLDHNKSINSKILVKRLLKDFISKYYGALALAIIFMVIIAATTALQAWIMKPILDKIFVGKDENLLHTISISIAAILTIKGFAMYFQSILTRNVENNILIDVQRKLHKKLLSNDISFLASYSSGKIISHFTNDINIMRQSISSVLTNIIRESLTLIFLLGLIFYYIPKLAVFTFVIIPIAAYPIYILGKKMRKISTRTQTELAGFTSQLDETIQGIKIVKAYNTEEIEQKRIFTLTENLKKLYRKAVRTDSLTSPLMETLGGIMLAVIILVGGYDVIKGELSSGTFFMFITAMLSAYKPMKSLTKLNNQLQQGLAATQRIFDLLDIKPKITSSNKGKKINIKNAQIKFEKVCFSYTKDSDKALNEISFTLEKGKTYALVGRSGSGKSTIMNLILRFYDRTKGQITIDNQDIKDVSLEDLRNQISYVAQDIFLFDDTIKANICYGVKGKITQAQISKAAKQAEAHEFIEELPNKYNTKIGPRGNLLSGGQKQRIILARAFLRNSPILLLDEATSALDNISEQKIQKAIAKLKQDRTCLIIAHRLNTIHSADKIFVMKGGKIISQGKHQSLLKSCPDYSALNLKD
jgi:subfamily B ATP-binding cassette protein MsbA